MIHETASIAKKNYGFQFCFGERLRLCLITFNYLSFGSLPQRTSSGVRVALKPTNFCGLLLGGGNIVGIVGTLVVSKILGRFLSIFSVITIIQPRPI